MTKTEFLSQLRTRLSPLSQGDTERSLDFYGEMIDDRMEDGMSEEEAVANVGDLDRIAEQILSQTSSKEEPTQESAPKEQTFRYVLRNPLLVGILSPLLLILWSVAISVVIALWAVVVALYAVNTVLGAVGGVLSAVGIIFCFTSGVGVGLLVLGAGVAMIGLTVLWGLGSNHATRGILRLTKLTFKGLVAMIFRKEETV